MLKRNNLITSKTGVNGGLALTKDMNKISLFDIFDSVEGSGPLFKIYDNFNKKILKAKPKDISHWINNEENALHNAQESMLKKLKEVHLTDIILK